MAMDVRIPMPTNRPTIGAMPSSSDVLTLAQWFSPGFPVGAYAYSHGLEWAIECGDVGDAKSTQQWISDVVLHGAGRNDCLFLVAAYRAKTTEDVAQVDASCRAFAPSRERLKEAVLQGGAFCEAVSAVWATDDLQSLSYPVAVGRAARLQGLQIELTTQMFLQSFVSNLAAAAMRLVPLGQTDGQRIIAGLMPLVLEVATVTQRQGLDDLGASAFLSDIASMKHETQYSRIFRT